jgi:hypothetical protein
MVGQVCNLNYLGGLQVWGEPKQHSKMMYQSEKEARDMSSVTKCLPGVHSHRNEPQKPIMIIIIKACLASTSPWIQTSVLGCIVKYSRKETQQRL